MEGHCKFLSTTKVSAYTALTLFSKKNYCYLDEGDNKKRANCLDPNYDPNDVVQDHYKYVF